VDLLAAGAHHTHARYVQMAVFAGVWIRFAFDFLLRAAHASVPHASGYGHGMADVIREFGGFSMQLPGAAVFGLQIALIFRRSTDSRSAYEWSQLCFAFPSALAKLTFGTIARLESARKLNVNFAFIELPPWFHSTMERVGRAAPCAARIFSSPASGGHTRNY